MELIQEQVDWIQADTSACDARRLGEAIHRLHQIPFMGKIIEACIPKGFMMP